MPLRFPASRSSVRVSTRRATSWAPSTTRWRRASATPRPARSSSSTTAPPTARARWPRRWSAPPARASGRAQRQPRVRRRAALRHRGRAHALRAAHRRRPPVRPRPARRVRALLDRADIVVGYRRRRQDPVGRGSTRAAGTGSCGACSGSTSATSTAPSSSPARTCSSASSSTRRRDDQHRADREGAPAGATAGRDWVSHHRGADRGPERGQPASRDPRLRELPGCADSLRTDSGERRASRSPPRGRRPRAARAAAGAAPAVLIVAVAAALRLYDLGPRAGNPFYDAAVRSMSLSWHNFFFGAFEPAGRLAVDKPPVDLWLQVASVKLFGFTSFALKLPEALGGHAAVPLLYDAGRRAFGRARRAGGGGSRSRCCRSPVLTSRSDTMDSVMMRARGRGALAAWCGAQKRRARLLLSRRPRCWARLQRQAVRGAAPVAPVVLLYRLAGPRGAARRLEHLVVAGGLMVVVSVSWATAVSRRPRTTGRSRSARPTGRCGTSCSCGTDWTGSTARRARARRRSYTTHPATIGSRSCGRARGVPARTRPAPRGC